MKKRLWIGTGAIALLMIVSLVAFNLGSRSSVEPTLAANEVEAIASDSTVQEITQTDVAKDVEAEPISSVADQSDGTQEGIKVRGRWTVEVSEPDGKLVSHTEFENALTTNGGGALSAYLAHNLSVGAWSISLVSTSGTPPCNISANLPAACRIWELPAFDPLLGAWGNHMFPDLTATSSGIGPNANALVLVGSATMGNDTTIDSVEAQPQGCSASIAPSIGKCSSGTMGFTAKTLSPGVAVLEGQIVNVTVVISFS